MHGTLNVHRVLRGTTTNHGYLGALTIDKRQERWLSHARDEVRKTLRNGLAQWSGLTKSSLLLEYRYANLAPRLPALRPRFRMQGSKVYCTLNDPAHKPPQEVDYDDGVFLPTSFLELNSSIRPLLASRGYFTAVQEVLGPTCSTNGWRLDTTKPSCVRVHIGAGAHIDLALYAIPDDKFTSLAEASARRTTYAAIPSPDSEVFLAEEIYKELPHDQIMLAHREKGWIESDPRRLEDWFVHAVNEHGKVLRRVCRYLKGWRDYQWTKGGPSSIALMVSVVNVFDQLNGRFPDNRDDLALQGVAGRLEGLFSTSIPNPVLPDQNLDDGWSPQDRLDFKGRAAALKGTIDATLSRAKDKRLALAQLRERFGVRLPSDETLVDVESVESEILGFERERTPAPRVPRTTSG